LVLKPLKKMRKMKEKIVENTKNLTFSQSGVRNGKMGTNIYRKTIQANHCY